MFIVLLLAEGIFLHRTPPSPRLDDLLTSFGALLGTPEGPTPASPSAVAACAGQNKKIYKPTNKIMLSGGFMDVVKTIFEGAKKLLALAEKSLKEGDVKPFSDTEYNLPVVYALFGREIKGKEDAAEILDKIRKKLEKEQTLENALKAGVYSYALLELVEAVKYAKENKTNFIPDTVIRSLGLPLVNGTIPGVAVVVGKAKDEEEMKKVLEEAVSHALLVLVVGECCNQYDKTKFTPEKNVIPIGAEPTNLAHVMNIVFRIPMIFAKIPPGEKKEIEEYITERVPAFVVVLGEIDEVVLALGAGCLRLGFPITTTNEAGKAVEQIFVGPAEKLIDEGVKRKGIKSKKLDIRLPMGYGNLYVGETIRKEDMALEFGGKKSKAFELVQKDDSIEDGKVEIIGKDIDGLAENANVGLIVSVAGDFEKDAEPVFERMIHEHLNKIEGFMHLASRDIIWCRFSNEAKKKGLKLKNLGEVLVRSMKQEFPLIEKASATIITDDDEFSKQLAHAKHVYKERDDRIKGLTEENVDMFYGCTMCQSFAPNHVCVITPERIALCGAITWLDAKTAMKINPSGMNFEIPKGSIIDNEKGEYEGVNKIVKQKSHGKIDRFHLHSIFGFPHTSCGCFEAIAFYIPEVDGIGIVHRDFKGETPIGMKFSTLAGMTGGGLQSEGLIGVGTAYVASKKAFLGQGGRGKIVWLPKELKERYKDDIPAEIFGKIASEEDVKDINELQKWVDGKK